MPPEQDDVAWRHRTAVAHAIRRRRAELAADRDALRTEPARVRAELARLRLTVSTEVAVAVRRLRDDAWRYLDAADRDARRAFPELLAAGATELTTRVRARLTALGLADADGTPPRPPPRPPAGHPGGVERRLAPLVGASGGLGLGRLLLVAMPADGVTGPLGVATIALAAGLGVAGACWLTASRRAVVERARLRRWTSDVLAELRTGLDAALTARLLAAERRLDAATAQRAAELATEHRELAGPGSAPSLSR